MLRALLPGLALCLAASPALAAVEVSPELAARIAADGRAPALVFFAPDRAAPESGESPEALIRRLQGNTRLAHDQLSAAVGEVEAGEIAELWISNACALTLDRAGLDRVVALAGVEKVLWDEPVAAPPVTIEADRSPEGEVTYGLAKLGIPQVRERFGLTGKGVVVGHLDTGIDPDHPDLKGKLLRYRNFRGWGNEPKDSDGHGTHTAATIAGGSTSGTSIGVAPDARLVVGRVIGWSFSGAASGLLKGMQWMLDPDENPATADAPRLVSMSWHSGGGDQTAFYEALATYEAAGVIPSFSAGNSGAGGITHPKEYPGNLVTAATDANDAIASFSSRGPAKYQGNTVQKPDWSAPGVAVHSAKPGGGYQKMSGTSMACPHASGVMALMLEADPTLNAALIKTVLSHTAKDLGEPGWDGAFGIGRLDAEEAVATVIASRNARVAAATAEAARQKVQSGRFLRLFAPLF